MVSKNRGTHGFLGASWVLITAAMAPVTGTHAVVNTCDCQQTCAWYTLVECLLITIKKKER